MVLKTSLSISYPCPPDLSRVEQIDSASCGFAVFSARSLAVRCGAERTTLWDLDDPRQRLQVYEIVLTEGNDDDVRRFIDIDELIGLWTQIGRAGCRERGEMLWG